MNIHKNLRVVKVEDGSYRIQRFYRSYSRSWFFCNQSSDRSQEYRNTEGSVVYFYDDKRSAVNDMFEFWDKDIKNNSLENIIGKDKLIQTTIEVVNSKEADAIMIESLDGKP